MGVVSAAAARILVFSTHPTRLFCRRMILADVF
jgi:hypothetical protein